MEQAITLPIMGDILNWTTGRDLLDEDDFVVLVHTVLVDPVRVEPSCQPCATILLNFERSGQDGRDDFR